jgi:hypothetical protein
VPVAALLPAALPVPRVEADEDALVEAVQEGAVGDHLGELGLEVPRPPQDLGPPRAGLGARDLHEPAADAVAHGDEDPVAPEDDRLGDLLRVLGPGVLPEDGTVSGVVAGEVVEGQHDDLANASECRQPGRAVGRGIVAPRPAPLAGARV